MLRNIFTRKKDIDWSGLERREGEEPLDVMLKHYRKFQDRYQGYSAHYVWQRWISF